MPDRIFLFLVLLLLVPVGCGHNNTVRPKDTKPPVDDAPPKETEISWDSKNITALGTLSGHKRHWVNSVAFSPDGKTLASGATDSSVRLWAVSTGKRKALLRGRAAGHMWSVAFSPDGRTLASGNSRGKILLWSTAAKQKPTTSQQTTTANNNKK